MRFIADLLGRYSNYTSAVAKGLARFGVGEVQGTIPGTPRSFDTPAKAAPVVPQVELNAGPAAETASEAEPEVNLAAQALDIVAGDREADSAVQTPASPGAGDLQADGLEPGMPNPEAMPMGVRGDVVVRWLKKLGKSERKDAPTLLEKLRKDKKVRVAELKIICSEVLGEPPQFRKKGEYLAVLRCHFAPAERMRPSAPDEVGLHVN